VDVNTADYAMILRIPGIGVTSALKIVQARKFGRLHKDQLKKMGIAFNRARHFMRYADSPMQLGDYESGHIKGVILADSKSKYSKIPANQLSLF
jgi:predicted DNA-binding helix-hairpin-helix protein